MHGLSRLGMLGEATTLALQGRMAVDTLLSLPVPRGLMDGELKAVYDALRRGGKAHS